MRGNVARWGRRGGGASGFRYGMKNEMRMHLFDGFCIKFARFFE